jgi:hypothetical protein
MGAGITSGGCCNCTSPVYVAFQGGKCTGQPSNVPLGVNTVDITQGGVTIATVATPASGNSAVFTIPAAPSGTLYYATVRTSIGPRWADTSLFFLNQKIGGSGTARSPYILGAVWPAAPNYLCYGPCPYPLPTTLNLALVSGADITLTYYPNGVYGGTFYQGTYYDVLPNPNWAWTQGGTGGFQLSGQIPSGHIGCSPLSYTYPSGTVTE